jgi:dolichyl-phosphate beta-glucosyltransferase
MLALREQTVAQLHQMAMGPMVCSFPHPRTLRMSGETVIVVPCYNEAERLDLCAFDTFLRDGDQAQLLFVDDGSTDGTLHELEKIRAAHPMRVTVYRSAENSGKGEAVRRGMQLALRRSPAFIGYWDADLATPLDAVHSFREILLARRELVLVMGSRVALLGRAIRRSWKRHLLGRAFATAASMVLGLSVYDTQCGAKLFRVTDETAALFRAKFRSRWVFDVEILARMLARSRATAVPPRVDFIYEFPLDRWEDVAGSRLKASDFAVAALDLAAIRWQYRHQPTKPSVPPPAPAWREAA